MKKQITAAAVVGCLAVSLAVVAQGVNGGGQQRGFHGGMHGPSGGPGGGERMLDTLAELGATVEQVDQVKALHFSHRTEMIDVQASVQKAHLALGQSLDNGDDDATVLALVEELNKVQGVAMKARFQHLLDVRAILGPELAAQVHDAMQEKRSKRGRGGDGARRGIGAE